MSALLSEISKVSVKDVTFTARKNPKNHKSGKGDLAHRQAPGLTSSSQRAENSLKKLPNSPPVN